tara:strand:+ start:30 stop:1232 length:1203 start_codon:yes stop_codon:yes gene_type:complete
MDELSHICCIYGGVYCCITDITLIESFIFKATALKLIMDIVGTVEYDKPVLAFYMGYSAAFNGENYNERNVYGSEIGIIHLAEALVDTYTVFVFVYCEPSDEISKNGVTYLSSWRIQSFTNIDIMIIVRYINYFLYYQSRAKQTYIMVTDQIFHSAFNGNMLPNHGKNLIHNVQHLIKGVICVSEWQRNNIMAVYNLPKLNYHIISNPIDTKFYKKDIHIVTNRFIYMQSPDRGLDLLLDCLLELQVHIPDISLTVFRKNDFTESLKYKLGKLNHTDIYGKVSQEELAGHCMRAEYFFYPTTFNETFCCCAAEAQLYNTVCIYGATGALTTTIGDRGLPIVYSINSPDYVKLVTKDLIELMNDEDKKQDFIKRGHEWARQLSPDYIKKSWIKLLDDTNSS